MSVLRIRGQDGKFHPIKTINGEDGKSAYEYAKDAGYTGSEEEFSTKLATKPTYTAAEVGALPDTTAIPIVPDNISAFANDAGYLTEHQSLEGLATEEWVEEKLATTPVVTETDPTVPAWAKESKKPNYTLKEISTTDAPFDNIMGNDLEAMMLSVDDHLAELNHESILNTNKREEFTQEINELSTKIKNTDFILYADSLDELNANGDKSKKYILPDGYMYEYDNISSNVTNVLDTVGYVKDKRLSSSQGTLVDCPDRYVTDFIPATTGSTIYLKNINATYNVPNEEFAGMVALYLADKTFKACLFVNPESMNEPTYDENNNLTSFCIGQIEIEYIRICAMYIDETSIITVNEEITEGCWKKTQYRFCSNNNIDSSNTNDNIPVYWQTALDEGVEAINTALCEAGRNKSAFLFYSDAHWNYGSQMSPTLLKYLYNHTGMTKTFFGGDIVNDEADDYDTMEYLWDWRRQLKDLPNHHSVVGNHDDGNSTNNLFSEQYVYGYLLAAEETPDMVVGDNGLYYYVDSPAEKTRYLCLDTAYQGVTNKQQEFVNDALMTTPDGWHIVAVSHIWHNTNYDVTPPTVSDISSDASILLSMFESYNNRSGEYAGCSGWVEFCIGGHTHWDYDSASNMGIPIILVETDSQHVRSGLAFSAGTTTEASVNGIIADYDAKKIKVVRIGRGESREVEMTWYEVSYTNVLPLALAADGVSIYNADDTPGYKANTRWSQSGQAEQEQAGTYLSGWIKVNGGDIIRLKNVNMLRSAGTTVMFFTNEIGQTTDSHNAEALTSYNSAVWDSTGNLTQFKIESGFSYIRLSCAGFSVASIITINEPID